MNTDHSLSFAAFALPLLFIQTQLASASSLAVGPDYRRPDLPTAAAYRDSSYGSWKPAAPSDATVQGEWWREFKDDDLNALEARALNGNQSLRASVARVDQARAAAGIARRRLARSQARAVRPNFHALATQPD